MKIKNNSEELYIVQLSEIEKKNIDENSFLLFLKQKNFYKELWKVALPIYLQLLSSTILVLINSLLLRWYHNGDYFATVWKANMIYSWLMFVPSFSAIGVFVVIGNLLGQKKFDELYKPIAVGWVFNIFLALIIIAFLLVIKSPALKWVNVTANEVGLANHVYFVNLFVILLNAINAICQRSESALGNTKLLFIIIFIGDGANTLAAYILVWLTPLQAAGVAYAQLLSYLSQIICLLYFMSKHFKLYLIFQNFFSCFSKRFVHQIILISIPTALEALASNLTGFFMSHYITNVSLRYGNNDVLLNVYTAVQQIVNFGLLMSVALGQTSAIFISRLIGTKIYHQAIPVSNNFWRLTLYISIPVTILLTFLSWPLLKLYNIPNFAIWQIGIYLFAINIFQEFGRTMNQVGLSCLQSANYTFVPLYYGIASLLIINVGLVSLLYYAVFTPKIFILLLWTVLGFEEIFRGSAYMILWRKKVWIKNAKKYLS